MGSSDLALTLAAMELHAWDLVLLEGHSKKPQAPEGAWVVTGDSNVAEEHVTTGGNLGLVCGPLPSSGVAVVDFDDPDAMREMFEKLGPLPITVVTGRGRAHCYAEHERWLPAKLKWDGEWVGEIQRGETEKNVPCRQQVVMPPSVHPITGEPYRWLGNPLEAPPRLPRSWRDHVRRSERVEAPVPVPRWKPSHDLPSAHELQARALQLPGGRRRTAGVKFQCPGCLAEGHDKHRDNAMVSNNGRWGCAFSPGDRVHRRAIAEALGVIG